MEGLTKRVQHMLGDGEIDDNQFDSDIKDLLMVWEKIAEYVKKHGNIALSCGGEWLYQDDEGQVDALELVADILDELEHFAKDEDDE